MIKKIFNKEIYGSLLFIFLISSINSPPSIPTEFNILNLFNFIRGLAPLLVFVFLLFLFLKKSFSLSKNSILFLIFISSQLIGHIDNEDRNFYNLYWIICAYSLVFLIEFCSDNTRGIKSLLFIFLSFLIIVVTVLSYSIIFEEISKILYNINHVATIYSSHVLAESTSFLGQSVPRSSGYTRMLLIIFFLLFSAVICQKKDELKKYKGILKKIIFCLIFIYIGLIFWKTQNRATLYFYIIIFIIYSVYTFFSFKKINLIRIFLIFLVPLILFNLDLKVKIDLIKKSADEKLKSQQSLNLDKQELNEWYDQYIKEKEKNLIDNNSRWRVPQETSGRIEIWKKSIPFIKKNFLFGQGPQSDRILLGKNASNILVYIFLCSGLFGVLLLFVYLVNLLIQYLRFINKFGLKNFNKDYLLIFSSLCVFFFLFRGLVENSFSVFGIDMIMFLLAVKYIEKFIDFQNNGQTLD